MTKMEKLIREMVKECKGFYYCKKNPCDYEKLCEMQPYKMIPPVRFENIHIEKATAYMNKRFEKEQKKRLPQGAFDCPLCGGIANYYRGRWFTYGIRCTKCDAKTEPWQNKSWAVRKWNEWARLILDNLKKEILGSVKMKEVERLIREMVGSCDGECDNCEYIGICDILSDGWPPSAWKELKIEHRVRKIKECCEENKGIKRCSCGGLAVHYAWNYYEGPPCEWQVVCLKCGAKTIVYDFMEHATREWNKMVIRETVKDKQS